jgi:hypothetical protein
VAGLRESITQKEKCGWWERQHGIASPTFYRQVRKKGEEQEGEQGALQRVQVIEVHHWGKFVPALNTAVMEAARQGFKVIGFQSIEVVTSWHRVERLYRALSEFPQVFLLQIWTF